MNVGLGQFADRAEEILGLVLKLFFKPVVEFAVPLYPSDAVKA
jgi:hypothetical protein